MKQNKINTKNENKNKKRNRFTPREHKRTLPINTSPLTDATTEKQNTQPRFKQYTSTTTTQYTQPTHKNHASTCTKPQLLPQYTAAFHCQPDTHHTLKRTYTHAPSTIIHQNADHPTHNLYCNSSAAPHTIPTNS